MPRLDALIRLELVRAPEVRARDKAADFVDRADALSSGTGEPMIMIDGAEGESRGQVVGSACALSLVTGQPFHVANVRGGREKPGLMRQHVPAIQAACAIGEAGVCKGVAVGSTEIVRRPGSVRGGEYRFEIGTAPSTGLVQTVLMPLLMADAPSRLVLEGGTHNMLAPPFEFIAKAFLPVINRMAPRVEARLVRHGFYPGGGGQIEVGIAPAPLTAIECIERGSLLRTSAIAFTADDLPPVVSYAFPTYGDVSLSPKGEIKL